MRRCGKGHLGFDLDSIPEDIERGAQGGDTKVGGEGEPTLLTLFQQAKIMSASGFHRSPYLNSHHFRTGSAATYSKCDYV